MEDKPVQFVTKGHFFQNGRQILQSVLSFSKQFCLINVQFSYDLY